jgi:hypothetical protein
MSERIRKVAVAYLGASVASGFALVLGLMLAALATLLMQGRWQDAGLAARLAPFTVFVSGFWTSAHIAVLAFVPAVVVIAAAEAVRLRSPLFYGGLASAGAIVFGTGLVRESGLLEMPGVALSWVPMQTLSAGTLMLVGGAAGLVGGLVYRSIAGIGAGDWRAPKGAQP